jgi:hypothetical protein
LAAVPGGQPYEFASIDRRGSLLWLAVVAAAVFAVAVLRWRGLLRRTTRIGEELRSRDQPLRR